MNAFSLLFSFLKGLYTLVNFLFLQIYFEYMVYIYI